MLPVFPEFKGLDLDDREEIIKITSKYPPYSDFNFTSLWSWDTQKKIKVSTLFDNLVLKFSDYLTAEPFYTFIGENKVNETAKILLDLSKKQGIPPILKLIPGTTSKLLDQKTFLIQSDRDNFDYLYLLEKISTYNGNQLRSKRNLSNRFCKNYTAETILLCIESLDIQKNIIDLCHLWAKNKKISAEETANELLAIHRIIRFSTSQKLISVGLFIDKKLVAFAINEIVNDDMVILHFEKFDNFYIGVNAYLMAQNANILKNLNKKILNYEQDLGLPGLRLGKKSYYPICLLQKDTVSYRYR